MPPRADTDAMVERWPPDPDVGGPPRCRCGNQVSESYHRYWSDNDGYLEACRECAPRSWRFTNDDIYGRDLEEFTAFDPEQSRNAPPAPSSQRTDTGDDDCPRLDVVRPMTDSE